MNLPSFHHAFLAIACIALQASANAACSRVMSVPVSPIGLSVIIKGADVSGVYPDVLRGLEKNGCHFTFSNVPRARLEAMFEAGRADLLVPATKTPKRDQLGVFVPLVQSRAVMISVDSARTRPTKLSDLVNDKSLRIAFVRGFDYGTAYQELRAELEKQGRLALETDALAIGRLMQAGLVDITVMAPSIFAGAIEGDARCAQLHHKLHFDAVPEFPWGESGVYISNKSVSKQDLQALQELLQNTAQSGAVWKAFQSYYRAEVLSGSIRPLPAK